MMKTFESFRDELFAQAKTKGFVDYEIFYTAGNDFSVKVLNGNIEEYKNTSNEGIGFRGTFDGKMGYAYTEKLTEDTIAPLLENAMANAQIIEDKDVENLYHGDESYPEANSYSDVLNTMEASEKIQLALDMESYAKSLDPRIKMIDYCVVGTKENVVAISNSYGLDVKQKQNIGMAYFMARVEENGSVKSALDYWTGRNFAEFDYKPFAKKIVDKALALLGAETIPSGEYPVILDRSVATEIIGGFSPVFMADKAQKGFSLLNKNQIGEEIASPIVTLRDDGVTDLSLGSLAFDAEGVATQSKAVIENGILKTMLYNTKAATKDCVKSTGNASKLGLGGAIETSVTNFYIVAGETSFDDMVAGLEKGVYITEIAGLHSGMNPVSGDFSFSSDGFLIEDGKISRPVEQITVAGNFYELLKNIKTIGNDLRFHSTGAGGIGMPSLLISGLNISGL
jgi:PmbA protein